MATPNVNGRVPLQRKMTWDEGKDALNNFGICSHNAHPVPFQSPLAEVPPGAAALLDGIQRKAPSPGYPPIKFFDVLELDYDPVNVIKSKLRIGLPVLLVMQITQSWEQIRRGIGSPRLDFQSARTGENHAIACLGYKDSETAFVIQDSFGTRAGTGGQWWLPYAAVVSSPSIIFHAIALTRKDLL
jgi:hypothetical protein